MVERKAKAILEGFKINSMTMADAATGKVLWRSDDWPADPTEELVARIPKQILKCRTVSREINFSSVELIEKFRLVQKVLLRGDVIEEWRFNFGFVIPGSTNTWQQTIDAADESAMIPPEVLSGNLTIETYFYDGDEFVNRSTVRVYYV